MQNLKQIRREKIWILYNASCCLAQDRAEEKQLILITSSNSANQNKKQTVENKNLEDHQPTRES